MSQGSSSSGARTRGCSAARVRSEQARLVLPPPPVPLDVALPPAVDEVSRLPLVPCPECKDVRLIALTVTRSTKNHGKRFFKCARNHQYVQGSCPIYFFQEDYKKYLQKNGLFGSTSLLDAVPELLQEFEDLKLGLDEVKEMVVKKNREPRINRFCVVLGCINFFFLLLGILLLVMK